MVHPGSPLWTPSSRRPPSGTHLSRNRATLTSHNAVSYRAPFTKNSSRPCIEEYALCTPTPKLTVHSTPDANVPLGVQMSIKATCHKQSNRSGMSDVPSAIQAGRGQARCPWPGRQIQGRICEEAPTPCFQRLYCSLWHHLGIKAMTPLCLVKGGAFIRSPTERAFDSISRYLYI